MVLCVCVFLSVDANSSFSGRVYVKISPLCMGSQFKCSLGRHQASVGVHPLARSQASSCQLARWWRLATQCEVTSLECRSSNPPFPKWKRLLKHLKHFPARAIYARAGCRVYFKLRRSLSNRRNCVNTIGIKRVFICKLRFKVSVFKFLAIFLHEKKY